MSDADEMLERLLEQERRLVFDRFDNDTAIALGLEIVERARQEQLSVVVDVSRGEQRLFYCALAGTSADNEFWVAGKNAVVRRFGHSSYYVGQRAKARGVDFAAGSLVDPSQFRAHGGAFPIIVEGTGMVGTATVSGLPQAEDHRLVVAAIESFLAKRGSAEQRPEVWTA